VLTFLREEVPRKWHVYCDTVTDNFRVIDPENFRILARTEYISCSRENPKSRLARNALKALIWPIRFFGFSRGQGIS
jgi:hypothetical protein